MKLKNVAYPIKSWRVPSQSDVGVYYTVELWSDGSLYDDCMAGKMRRNCKHKQKVRDFLQRNEPETYEKLKKPKLNKETKS